MYSRNGEDEISNADLAGEALFPHIIPMNVKFEVNFGIDKEAADKENWKEHIDTAFVKVDKVEE